MICLELKNFRIRCYLEIDVIWKYSRPISSFPKTKQDREAKKLAQTHILSLKLVSGILISHVILLLLS